MNRVAAVAKITPRLFLAQLGSKQLQRGIAKPCDVFINHRGVDTKKTVAALLYDRLIRGNFRPFLDYRNLKPGEKLFDELHGAIRQCKVGVAVFSPRYCESYFCLHELAMIIESNKKLRIKEDDGYETEDLRRFNWALEQANQLEGIKFNSSKQTLSDIVTRASNIVISSLVEMDGRDEQ
ncbi:uncharacterized protein LOC111496557 isoform X2 [Cucurbita maxima]|uniref:Uncharacterized protein LOC111496557 isoform X2 n=1 Tax=Cucurbita maxima TaxID=3661 RepID=A0A6J1KUX9_CUCMA|nr:uncharacterized protein LOC111496557 isoform X2 [Cucurbita maxima]